MEKLYICVMHSGKLTGEIVRLFTKNAPFSHVGFSYSKKLDPLYSFGRRFWFFPFPGGFVTQGLGTKFFNNCPRGRMKVFELEITRGQKELINKRLEPFLASPLSYKYNYFNILSHIIKKPCHLKNAYVCTSFCGEMLDGIINNDKDTTMLTPQFFADLPLPVIYEGLFKNYNCK